MTQRTLGLDLRPSARTGTGLPGLGGMLATAAGAAIGGIALIRRGPLTLPLLAVGVGLAYRGMTGTGMLGRLVDVRELPGVRSRSDLAWRRDRTVRRSITVQRERDAVHDAWRHPDRFGGAGLLAEARSLADGTVEWRLAGPGPLSRTMRLRLVEDVPRTRLAWAEADAGAPATPAGAAAASTVPQLPAEASEAEIDAALDELDRRIRVSIDLQDAPGDRGTEVHLAVRLPAGMERLPLVDGLVGGALEELLRRSRWILETGRVPTTDGQSSGREALA